MSEVGKNLEENEEVVSEEDAQQLERYNLFQKEQEEIPKLEECSAEQEKAEKTGF